ncbi:hypothetical protein [Streptomyces sp. MK5]|uniref:hypothetical protein n=1 Tax=Streptomyces sp. MK5 TaxID=3064253 RepID=UPI002741C201|nr:hypothetical protein [Streptomyces sp. MK5]
MPSITYQLAAEAAPLMPGGGWTARPSAASGKEGAVLEHPDGRRIEISPARREGYVRARVAYPDTSYSLMQRHRPRTEMRADRGGRALEQAVRTKLLPVYDETYPKVLAANEESRKHAETRAAVADHLVALVPGAEVTRSEPSLIVEYRKRGTIERVTAQVLGDGLNIVTFRYVGDEATEAVMKAYGEVTRRTTAAPDNRSGDASEAAR